MPFVADVSVKVMGLALAVLLRMAIKGFFVGVAKYFPEVIRSFDWHCVMNPSCSLARTPLNSPA